MKRTVLLLLVFASCVALLVSCQAPCKHSYQRTVLLPAGCVTAGKAELTCALCRHGYTEQIPALGHVSTRIAPQEPTCTQEGYTQGLQCQVCQAVLEEPSAVPALGHTPEKIPGRLPTCTADGVTEGSECRVCRQVLTQAVPIARHGHKVRVVQAAVLPTCTTDGYTEESQCDICRAVLTQRVRIPATGHKEQTVPAVEATCDTDGRTQGVACRVCGEEIEPGQRIPATGHRYHDGVCRVCNAPGVSANMRYTYQAMYDSYELVSPGQFLGGDLFVPAQYNGKRVMSIRENAFKGLTTLRTAYLGSLSQIWNEAFCGCENLTQVTVKPGLQRLHDRVFADCISLKWVILPATLQGPLEEGLFDNCPALEAIYTQYTQDSALMLQALAQYGVPVYTVEQWHLVDGVPTLK